MDILNKTKDINQYIISRRRFYHANPELTFKEIETRANIHRDLLDIGITDIRNMKDCYGLIATIHGGHKGKTVGLRADIDALPTKEDTNLPFCSTNDGVMHSCGHDCHIAMLLGAAKILYSIKDNLYGDVRLIFQPAEEACAGAKMMIAEDALDGVDVIYGNHVWGYLPSSYISIESGPRLAYAGFFEIDIDGLSAHGGSPHLGHDAITAAASVIMNLQQYVSRMNNPLSPLVLTIGTINGGSRSNIISNHVQMTGTIRAYSSENHIEAMTPIVEKTAECLGCKGTLNYHHAVYPVVNKFDEITLLAQNSAKKLYGDSILGHQEKMLISEDFSEYLTYIPGVFSFIGTKDVEHPFSNHHEKFDIDEGILQRGTALMSQFTVDYLENTK